MSHDSNAVSDPGIRKAIAEMGLEGRRLYLPQMPYGGTYLLAAAIRSIGFDAWPTTDSDERTLELGGRMTSGDECYPQKITMGDFLRMIEDEGRDKVAFLMPTANGPCRFGQYLHLIKAKFGELGYDDIPVISITSSDGYSSIGSYSQDLVRTAWRAVLAQDILMKFLLKTRPYEREKGSTDAVYRKSLEEAGEALSLQQVSHKERLDALVKALARAGERFRAIPADYDRSRPLIGVVGEIFCRLNTFSQLRPHPPGRGARRRVLAGRHRRVGLVHGRRASAPAARRGPALLQGQRRPHDQGEDHAARRARAATARSSRTSSATRSRTR